MIQAEFEKFAKAGQVGTVILYTGPGVDGWEVWAHGHTNEGENDPLSSWGNRLATTRQGQAKTYASLDRAYKAIRELGYRGQIQIDG